MKKRILSILLGLTMSVQGLCFTAPAYAETPLEIRSLQISTVPFSAPAEITMTEGESVWLDLPVDPDMPEIQNIFSLEQKTVVTQDLKLTALSEGDETVSVYIHYKGTSFTDTATIKVHITRNDSITEETRKELERLERLDGCYRRRMELLGALYENVPRIDMDKVLNVLASTEDYLDIPARFNDYHIIADQISGSGMTSYTYWFDDKGNESVSWCREQEMVTYTKTNDKGIVEEVQFLYPEKSEVYKDGKNINYDYMQYNQVKPEGTGSVKLTMIDEETGKPFTETNGTFRFISKLYDEDGNVAEDVYKSWKSSEGTTVTIDELPLDHSYELRYIDEYHEDENGNLYKYEVDKNKGTHGYYFGLVPRDYDFNVYLKRQYKNDPIYIGNVDKEELSQVKIIYDDVFSESELGSLMQEINSKVDEFVSLMQEKNMSEADISEYSLAYRQQLCREMLLPKREAVCDKILSSIGVSKDSAYCSFEFPEIRCALTDKQIEKLNTLDIVEKVTKTDISPVDGKSSYRLREALESDAKALTVMIKYEDVFSEAELKELNENLSKAVEEYRQELISAGVSGIEQKCFKFEQQLRKGKIYDPRCERVKAIMTAVGVEFDEESYSGEAASLTRQLTPEQIKNLSANEYVTKLIWNEEDYDFGGPDVFNKTSGDANCDGTINLADAVLIMQYVAAPTKYPLTEQGIINGDVVGNDGITNKDALAIQSRLLGLDNKA